LFVLIDPVHYCRICVMSWRVNCRETSRTLFRQCSCQSAS